MRRLLDDAAGESGPYGAAPPHSGGGCCDTRPVCDGGSRCAEGLSSAALPCGSEWRRDAAPASCVALALGQVGQSDGSVDLPPALGVSSPLASVLLPVPKDVKETAA